MWSTVSYGIVFIVFLNKTTFESAYLVCRTSFTMCRASDPDAGVNGEISYSLSARSAADYGRLFSVDSRTGRIAQRVAIDYEEHRDPITLHVVADDGGDGTIPATARVVVTVRDVNDHTPRIRFENTGTGSDVTGSENDGGSDDTRRLIGASENGSYVVGSEVDGSIKIAGSDVTGSEINVGGSEDEVAGSGSDVLSLRVAEHGAAGEFLAHMSVEDLDSGSAGHVHCTMPSLHFTIVPMYPNEYKVSSVHFYEQLSNRFRRLQTFIIVSVCN